MALLLLFSFCDGTSTGVAVRRSSAFESPLLLPFRFQIGPGTAMTKMKYGKTGRELAKNTGGLVSVTLPWMRPCRYGGQLHLLRFG